VGLEFRLPDTAGRLRLKAVVRYQALLHCGLEFLNLTAEQQTLIEHWTRKKSGLNPSAQLPVVQKEPVAPSSLDAPAPPPPPAPEPEMQRPSRVLWWLVAGLLVFGGLIWWQWSRAWNELEAQLPATRTLEKQAQAVVPAEIMEGRVLHKVEPIYPEAARQANIHGIVVLDTVVSADGAVIDVRPVSGPEELATAAADALKWWRFQPYVLNGQAVPVRTRLAVEFRGN
jgi:TonB family protein